VLETRPGKVWIQIPPMESLAREGSDDH